MGTNYGTISTMHELAKRLLRTIRKQELLRAGDRVAVAVSGGADSVALLCLLGELRDELGIVLSVVHVNHKLRGAESDEDERFVMELAAAHALEFHTVNAPVESKRASGGGHSPAHFRGRGSGPRVALRILSRVGDSGSCREDCDGSHPGRSGGDRAAAHLPRHWHSRAGGNSSPTPTGEPREQKGSQESWGRTLRKGSAVRG